MSLNASWRANEYTFYANRRKRMDTTQFEHVSEAELDRATGGLSLSFSFGPLIPIVTPTNAAETAWFNSVNASVDSALGKVGGPEGINKAIATALGGKSLGGLFKFR
jgi:hypothetical protein